MQQQTGPISPPPDSAAVFASALSLWQAGKVYAFGDYKGADQFRREVMRVAHHFAAWTRLHIKIDALQDEWSELLEKSFGDACLAVVPQSSLTEFDDRHCLRVAMRLRLPIRLDDNLRLPVDATALNPILGSVFPAFRIQTVRDSVEGNFSAPFTPDDDPFDEEFSAPYFGLYGVSNDGLLEHIADRESYAEAVSLASKLAPDIEFLITPTFIAKP
jgi:hypothetical protein